MLLCLSNHGSIECQTSAKKWMQNELGLIEMICFDKMPEL